MSKTSKPAHRPSTIEALIADAMAIATKKNKKRSDTLHEARKRRDKRKNVLLVKQEINDENYQILKGTMRPALIHCEVQEQRCANCQESQHIVKRMVIIHEDCKGDHHILGKEWEIENSSQYWFNQHLPIKYRTHEKIIPRCYTCLVSDTLERQRRSQDELDKTGT